MGQQLRIRLKRQRRHRWIERKKKTDKAKVKSSVAKAENSAKPSS